MNKEEFKQIRKDLSLTQKQFAEKLGKNVRTIQRMESGEYNVWAGVCEAVENLKAIGKQDDR
jgi:transcriptional regulator with XRE-family HTH domain